MNSVHLGWFLFINCLYDSIATSDIRGIKSCNTQNVYKKRITFIDVLEEDLKNITWRKDEKPCYDLILLIINNIQNGTLWSTWVWDSMQLPNGVLYGSRYQLGNFDECMEPPWLHSHPELRTQYCLADVQMTKSKPLQPVEDFDPHSSVETYINTLTKYHQLLNVVTWGVCMPVTCKPHSISKFLNILYANSHLGHISQDPEITVGSCQVAGSHQYSTAYYTFWIVMLSLIILAIISTYFVNNANKMPGSAVTVITNAFCMKRNMYDLVKKAKDDIPVMHSMRVLSACVIVMMHCFMVLCLSPIGNGMDIDKTIELIPQMMHLDLVVDTFLLMSGLLHAKGLMSKRDSPVMVLVKRYVRFIGPSALLVFYSSKVAWHEGSGPMWPKLSGDILQRRCNDNWWLNLLMINNYFKTNEICHPVTWYIACDYQLTILGTMLFWIFCRNRRVGQLVFAVVAVLAVLLPGIVTYWNNLHALAVYDFDSSTKFLQSEEFIIAYSRSHYRMAPYIIGLATGYFMTIYKPVQYRNIISTTWTSIIGVAGVICAAIPLILAGMLVKSQEYNAMNEAVFAATNRIIWTLAANTCIILAEYGTMPSQFFASFLTFLVWPVWVPLSRLSYGLYLVHLLVIIRNMAATRTPLQLDMFTMISNTFGVLFLGFFFSLLIWLFVQAPFVNLMNTILDKKTKPTETRNGNGYTKQEKSN